MFNIKADLKAELETKVWYRVMKVLGWITFVVVGGILLLCGIFVPIFYQEYEALWCLPLIPPLYYFLKLIGKTAVYIVAGKW